MTKCKHWDCGWCNAPDDVKTSALGSGVCDLPECCPYLKSQNQMTGMIFLTDGEVTHGTKCPTHKLEIKKMTEIEKTEGEIKVLQAKLELLKEMENSKSSAERAYCEVYGEYPRSCARWNGFLTGYDLGYIHGAEGKDKFVPHQEHFGLKKGN